MGQATSAPRLTADDASTTRSRFWLGPIDLLPLALFRIAFGLLLVEDTCELLPNLRAFYSDDGIWPRALALRDPDCALSLFWITGTHWAVGALWAATVLSAAALALGLFTRVATVACFVLVASVHARFPFVLDSADAVVRIFLLLLCFCPAGNRLSIDARRAAAAGRPLPTHAPALPVRLLQVQIAVVYYASGTWKLQGIRWRDGTAVHYAWSVPHLVTRPWAVAIANVAWLVKATTWGTLAVELAFLFAMFSPWRRRRVKALALVAGLALHFGIAATMGVGLFSYVMPVSYLVLLEPGWARAAVARLGPASAIPWKAPARPPYWRAIASVALVLLFLSIQWASSPARERMPRPLFAILNAARVWGTWAMFAPKPLDADVHLRAPALLSDGTRIDLFGGPADGPGEVHGAFYSRAWKLDENLASGRPNLVRAWSAWQCRQRAGEPGARGNPSLVGFSLVSETWHVPPLGEVAPPATSRELIVARCKDGALAGGP